jgi:beta-glucuronidase
MLLKASIKMLLSVCLLGVAATVPLSAATFTLSDTGTEVVIDYAAYGRFEGVGTENYKYVITNSSGLKEAAGEGIFPNTVSVYRDPAYKQLKAAGKLTGTHWDYVDGDDYAANFYKWATAAEDPGVKQYYAALALEKSGNLTHAVKAYYSVVVNFPRANGFTYWGTPWYIGPVAIDKIRYITREHPELKVRLVGASIKIKNSFDADLKNDVFTVDPGKLVATNGEKIDEPKIDVRSLPAVKTVGEGKVKLVQYTNKHWQLFVDGKPYVVRGIAYSPNKVGLSPDRGTLNASRDWMFADYNKNGKIDGPYEAWVDKNRNNKQDHGEKPVGDFQLMKDMGVNTLRIYHFRNLNKDLMMDGYKTYGFMYMMGDLLGMYATESGADWFSGTDYTNPAHQQKMLDSVRQMVEEYKDQPYILMWVLGNENNYAEPGAPGVGSGNGCRAKLQPEAYYKFVNEAAKLVKSLDPQKRPVAICNGDILYLDYCAADAPEIDIFGANAYRGEQGFGSLWRDVADVFDRPVVVTEYGCSAYHPDWDQKRAEEGQANYLKGNWMDIESNTAGIGAGDALGGVLFEWSDEWWKANSDLPLKVQQQKKNWYAARSAQYKNLQPDKQDTVPQFGAPFLDGWSYEEWLGITSQGDGKQSPFLRQLRPAYFMYKELWKKYK